MAAPCITTQVPVSIQNRDLDALHADLASDPQFATRTWSHFNHTALFFTIETQWWEGFQALYPFSNPEAVSIYKDTIVHTAVRSFDESEPESHAILDFILARHPPLMLCKRNEVAETPLHNASDANAIAILHRHPWIALQRNTEGCTLAEIMAYHRYNKRTVMALLSLCPTNIAELYRMIPVYLRCNPSIVRVLYALDPTIPFNGKIPTEDTITNVRWYIHFRFSLIQRLLFELSIPEWTERGCI